MSIKTYIKGHSGVATFLVILVVIFGVVGGRLATKQAAPASVSNVKRVTLVEAKTFRDDLTTVGVEGVVESASQADIRSQVSAPVSQVYVSVGDTVFAGQMIVEFQNADIRAQLDQAKANLALAEGEYSAGSVSTDSARKSAIDKIRDSYQKVDDIFNSQIGQFLFNSNPSSKQLQALITDSTIGNRLNLEWSNTDSTIKTFKKNIDVLGDNSTKEQITAALGVAQTTLQTLSGLLDTVSAALVNAGKGANESDVVTINGWKTTTSAARSSVGGLIATLTGSGSSLSASEAQISGARAGVKNLEAQLGKTMIRAPFTGTIASLPLRTGELATPGQLVTTIVGSGALEIKAYAASEDLERIKKGAIVLVEGKIPGVVTNFSTSVSQASKKIEVRISVPSGEKTNLVVGQSIQAKIQAAPKTGTTAATRDPHYVLPIQDVKIVPDAAYVYTVDANKKIVKHVVTLGEVKGDFVEVKTGLTDEMNIVSPVYELEEGEVVNIQ